MARPVQEKPVVRPVASIVKKRNWLVPILALVVLVITGVLIYFYMQPTHGKTIYATVNGEPLYREDLEAEYSRIPDSFRSQITFESFVNDTINTKLILQEAKDRDITASDAEIDAQIDEIAAQYGVERRQLREIIELQNESFAVFRESVSDRIVYMKVLREVIDSRIAVSDKEVVAYYEENPEEFSAPRNGAVISHILVANESEARALIVQLGEGTSFSILADKYSLDPVTAENGGYIGVVTNESTRISDSLPMSAEFKRAALRLREGQYTRNPVEDTAGYHVILRNSDIEPLRIVRSRVKDTIEQRKREEAYKTFIESLRSKADIRFYTHKGVVSQQPQPDTSLDAFATCVAGESTLYGTSWSQFFQEQQALFGESFTKLNYVDCDAKPHLCAAANIEKYPTWIVGDERYGKLTLKQLSDVTGCRLP